ncbi:MAG TPA: L-threonylcarbamoyladenylate synthase [Solirubrobacteraceae bacterium]|jgi:L-threonylcarbamoyladenylate synthase|nr:L-threonylcarbamoyladenylate synthase [Solirubrobacteraceae bacterium]
MSSSLSSDDAERLRACVAGGGIAVLPTDTVYGVCCDPDDAAAAQRLYELKGRPPARPAAVMFFALEYAVRALPELSYFERRALEALLPGPVTVLLENRASRFLPACRSDPSTVGLRVPWLPESLHTLCEIAEPVMQSSANISGESDARTLDEVPLALRDGADVVLDGGTLPGTASTVVDMRDYEASGSWHVLREGPLAAEAVRELLDAAR